VVTPPDVISQLALAIPMCILYEVGMAAAKWFVKVSKAPDAAEAPDAATETAASSDAATSDTSGTSAPR
jgi:sec-independent protein translocase protein TatC